MRNDIADKIRGGLPCIAECGGYLYLHKKLEAPDKKVYPMAGVIDGTGYNAEVWIYDTHSRQKYYAC